MFRHVELTRKVKLIHRPSLYGESLPARLNTQQSQYTGNELFLNQFGLFNAVEIGVLEFHGL